MFIYAVFRDNLDPYEPDEFIEAYAEREDAEKYINNQGNHHYWYHIREVKVR